MLQSIIKCNVFCRTGRRLDPVILFCHQVILMRKCMNCWCIWSKHWWNFFKWWSVIILLGVDVCCLVCTTIKFINLILLTWTSFSFSLLILFLFSPSLFWLQCSFLSWFSMSIIKPAARCLHIFLVIESQKIIYIMNKLENI